MQEARTLFEQANPYGTFAVSIEEDGRTLYMYLSPLKDPGQQPKAVWLRNLLPAPGETDREAMRNGIAPLLKRASCNHPDGAQLPPVEELGLLWFQEGNGVALYFKGELEAVIPPWSGRDGLFGYSAACLATDAGTVPLTRENSGLFDRIRDNELFWERRAKPDYWGSYRDALLAHYEKSYGPHTNYYALTDRPYPPIGIAQFRHDDLDLFATVGMSFQNMPGVELAKRDPLLTLRAELLTARLDAPDYLPGLIGRMAFFPWLYNRFIDAGHTYESGMTHPFTDFLYAECGAPFLEHPGEFLSEGIPVHFMNALPVTQEDLLVARARDTNFLLKKITERATPAFRWP